MFYFLLDQKVNKKSRLQRLPASMLSSAKFGRAIPALAGLPGLSKLMLRLSLSPVEADIACDGNSKCYCSLFSYSYFSLRVLLKFSWCALVFFVSEW
jgi:hypothetical protein